MTIQSTAIVCSLYGGISKDLGQAIVASDVHQGMDIV